MKKIFAFAMVLCLVVGMLSVTAFAAEEPASDIVLRVSAEKRDGSVIVIDDYKDFEDGWNAAMGLAANSKEMKNGGFARVIVDIYADWVADNGEFGDEGNGFSHYAILFPKESRVTLNLNGHTLDRAIRNEYQFNGEVVFIDENADVIINDGTVTGGWSSTGAGGIYINDHAKVTLNNVNVKGNITEGANGAGIAVYDGATLVMNGGTVCDNVAISGALEEALGVGIYAEDSSVVLNKVTVKNNQCKDYAKGIAIYANDSAVSLNACLIVGNGFKVTEVLGAHSVIACANDSSITVKDTTFTDNGVHEEFYIENVLYRTVLIDIISGSFSLDNCVFNENKSLVLIESMGGAFNATKTTFSDNKSTVFLGYCDGGEKNTFTKCTFKNNTPSKRYPYVFNFSSTGANLNFVDCTLGNSNFNNKGAAKIEKSGPLMLASVFSEGSVVMIVILLVVAVGAAVVILVYKKKSAAKAEKAE